MVLVEQSEPRTNGAVSTRVQKTIPYNPGQPPWGNEDNVCMRLVANMNATDPNGAIWALTANNTNTGVATMTRFTGGARPHSLTFDEFSDMMDGLRPVAAAVGRKMTTVGV